jgi:hypothetical protein
LFIVPLDEVRGWWRYHHLFADLLRARLEQTRPEHVPELHRAAAAWHEAHGFADDAVRHALAVGDIAWAARLVEEHVEALLRRSEGATLGRWLSARRRRRSAPGHACVWPRRSPLSYAANRRRSSRCWPPPSARGPRVAKSRTSRRSGGR